MIPEVLITLTPAVVQQADVRSFSVTGGAAPDVILRLADQADIDVVIAADLSGRRSRGLTGRMTPSLALDRLVRPLGARAVRIGPRTWRIEAAPASSARRPPTPPPPPPGPVRLSEVVVTAPAPRGGLQGGPGQTLADPDALDRASMSLAGAAAVSDLSASVDSTRQGPGRNKLFVRGVADSAFNGPLQATVGQYLGDMRLTYGSPDPDLLLVDIRRIEVFEGPQSARFASGSIGGVVRIEPRPAALEDTSLAIAAGASATSGGKAGADAALVFNTPLGSAAAARVVAYLRHDGGFVDNTLLGDEDVDGVEIAGARGTLRAAAGPWTIDVTAAAQGISSEDASSVAARAEKAKTRRIAEPYESDFALGGMTASRRFDRAHFTWASSLSWQALEERFDASAPDGLKPAWVDRRQTVRAFSSEARMESDDSGRWWWNGGVATAFGETRSDRSRWESEAPVHRLNLRRRFAEAVVFGEAVTRPAPDWQVALGGRLAVAGAHHEVQASSLNTRDDTPPDSVEVFVAPSLSVVWTRPQGGELFGRVEQGVRPGSVSEANGRFERYSADRVTLLELGARTPRRANAPWGELSIGWLDWRDIQADVATQGGELVTGNIGDGVVHFAQARLAWSPDDRLSLSGSVFLNDGQVSLDGVNIIGVSGGDIPGVARSGAQFSLSYEAGPIGGAWLQLGADLRYVGRSRPGLGPGLDVPQGDYIDADLSARLGDDQRGISLTISNPFDVSAIRYGVGSPYQLSEPQGVPLRPFSLRLGFEAAF